MNSVRSNSLSLKFQGFPTSGCQDIRSRKFKFGAKTQFLLRTYMLSALNSLYKNSIYAKPNKSLYPKPEVPNLKRL